MMKSHKIVTLIFAIIIIGILTFYQINHNNINRQPLQSHASGLERTPCWFETENDWPHTECYTMHVPQNHAKPDGVSISFPVLIFKSNSPDASKSPLLHMGAGGPGSAMFLGDSNSVKFTWEVHDEISLNQGRNLIIIDPRGSGLASPLLNCPQYINNQYKRLQKNLSLKQEYIQTDSDYKECINIQKKRGIDFEQYNSLVIAQDVEMLRQQLAIKQWVLLGVSYSTMYAQIIATEFPDTVESLILDSAVFPHLKLHHNFIENTLAPYQALFNYCKKSDKCKNIPDLENKFWALQKHLEKHPITVEINHPLKNEKLTMVLNGDRFIIAIIEGVYDEQIFTDLPIIIKELNNGDTTTMEPYLEYLALYYLDSTFADVSFYIHYCIETKPFSDFDLIKKAAQSLPDGYIKQTTMLDLDWPDYCDDFGITKGDNRLATATNTNIPTLFLHGKYDPITPLRDVLSSAKTFKNHQIATFDLSHDILSSNECAETITSIFVDTHEIQEQYDDCLLYTKIQ